jgi:hypothetical protein
MLLRICLVLAILAGLGVIGLSQFVLRPQIQEIVDTRDKNKTEWDKAAADARKQKKEKEETQAKLKVTESNLEETKGQLAAMTAKANSEQTRANGLQSELTKTKGDLKNASDELFRWKSVAQGPEQVQELVSNVKTLTTANEAFKAENTLFKDKIKQQEARIKELVGGAVDPPVPHDVKGKVLVVDPKWDFVILDVGAKNNVPERGILLVSRNGTLVAKLRVASVEESRSVANVLPGWKLGDIVEGDTVLAY